MPFRISFVQPSWSLKAVTAAWTAEIMASPEYSLNLNPVPLPVRGSHCSIVSSSPPVALTIGTVRVGSKSGSARMARNATASGNMSATASTLCAIAASERDIVADLLWEHPVQPLEQVFVIFVARSQNGQDHLFRCNAIGGLPRLNRNPFATRTARRYRSRNLRIGIVQPKLREQVFLALDFTGFKSADE